ncbi:MAG TPA: hypothetical protein VK171_01090, partial [Fimbriimonas sp.]|nr:hypothetical protein [Fimbriimonas sp.]
DKAAWSELSVNESQPARNGLKDFALIVGGLAVVRMVLPFIPVPKVIAPVADFLLLVGIFLATVYAIYRAMSSKPTPVQAGLMLLAGVAIQAAFIGVAILNNKVGIWAIISQGLAQTGLMVWCIGLGALIASLLREKNIVIPVALFLIAFDIFLVLTPQGFTQKMMKANPQVFTNMAMAIPKVATETQQASSSAVLEAAYVGPADLVFLGTFFLAMFRFNMEPKETLKLMVPVLVVYMLFVTLTGIALPALVPIGLVTLLVNRKEFKLSKDELASTLVLTVLLISGLIYLATKKKAPPVEPSPSANAQEFQIPAGSPAPVMANQPQ